MARDAQRWPGASRHADQVGAAMVQRAGWTAPLEVRLLGTAEETGVVTELIRFDRGYQLPAATETAGTETFVLDGALRVGDIVRTVGSYAFIPGGLERPQLVAIEETTVLWRTWPDARREYGRTTPLLVDGYRLPWRSGSDIWPGDDLPGESFRILHDDAATGATVMLAAGVPWIEDERIEYHACMQEYFMLLGDLWIGGYGTLTAGSYVAIPPYTTHDPSSTRAGYLMLLWNDGPLEHHHVDDHNRTPEENEAAARDRDQV